MYVITVSWRCIQEGAEEVVVMGYCSM